MDRLIGFLESEFGQVLAARGTSAVAQDNEAPTEDGARSADARPERERRFRELLDALPAAVYTTDAAGRLTYFNDAAVELWGCQPRLGTNQWCGSWKLFWPDGAPMAHEECPMAIAIAENRVVRGIEVACERPDGTRVPILPYPTPLYDQQGRLVGAVNLLVDITERKRAEEQQALLVRELHHRVRNTLATVQAIMGSTARSAETIEDFTEAMIGRIGALAKTHVLLAEDGKTLSFADIVRSELDPFEDISETRIHTDGPEVAITSSRVAMTLGMALHELTTNAAKFGALSVCGGRVDVTWSVTVEAARRILEFSWVESGGPTVKPPQRQGFGSRLIDFVLPGQIQARSRIDYAPEGIRVQCVLPLPTEPAL
jgi:PAS domain S-box-containing protein